MDLRGCGEEWSPETLQLEDMKVGSLLCVMKELRSLVEQNCGTSIASKDSLEVCLLIYRVPVPKTTKYIR